MKPRLWHFLATTSALLALGAGSAQAAGVHWNVGIHAAPGVTVGVGNGYYAPSPVYVAPAPIYVAPPLYAAPRYYVQPAPVYYAPPVHHRGHRHHHQHRGHRHGHRR